MVSVSSPRRWRDTPGLESLVMMRSPLLVRSTAVEIWVIRWVIGYRAERSDDWPLSCRCVGRLRRADGAGRVRGSTGGHRGAAIAVPVCRPCGDRDSSSYFDRDSYEVSCTRSR